MRIVVVIFLMLFILRGVSAQDNHQDTTPSKRFKILPVPTFGYEPETSTYVGAVALATLDFYNNDLTRSSNVSLEFTYSWKKQIIVETDWDYFFDNEKWFTKGQLHYSKYPDQLYLSVGAGCDICNYFFESDRFIADVFIYKKLRKHLFIGTNLRYLSYANIEGGIPEDLDINAASVSGVGLSILYDSRNNILTSTKGAYVDVTWQVNKTQVSSYYKFILDLRKYLAFGEGRHTLAMRLYNAMNTGVPPFFDEAYVGGDQYVRGFFYGRYRSHNMSTMQLEYRSHLFWRMGLAIFGGYSSAYEQGDLSSATWRYNLGTGLRVQVDKQEGTNFRIDYAIGQDGNSGFYFSFGESF